MPARITFPNDFYLIVCEEKAFSSPFRLSTGTVGRSMNPTEYINTKEYTGPLTGDLHLPADDRVFMANTMYTVAMAVACRLNISEFETVQKVDGKGRSDIRLYSDIAKAAAMRLAGLESSGTPLRRMNEHSSQTLPYIASFYDRGVREDWGFQESDGCRHAPLVDRIMDGDGTLLRMRFPVFGRVSVGLPLPKADRREWHLRSNIVAGLNAATLFRVAAERGSLRDAERGYYLRMDLSNERLVDAFCDGIEGIEGGSRDVALVGNTAGRFDPAGAVSGPVRSSAICDEYELSTGCLLQHYRVLPENSDRVMSLVDHRTTVAVRADQVGADTDFSIISRYGEDWRFLRSVEEALAIHALEGGCGLDGILVPAIRARLGLEG